MTNLWRFTREQGADLTVFSGGKDPRGPRASGLLVGRSEMIAACAAHGSPHQRLGRPMKVGNGKEEMVGLPRAVELYLAEDQAARLAEFEATVAFWVRELAGLPGVTAQRHFPNEAGQPLPRARLDFDPARGWTAAVAQALWEGEPGIAVMVTRGALYLTPDTIAPGDETIIATRPRSILGHEA